VVLYCVLHVLIHLVKMELLNVNIDMLPKQDSLLCFMHVFHCLFGLRPFQQLFISSTDSPHKLLLAKLLTSFCLVNNPTTLCFVLLDVYAFLICEIMLLTNYLPNLLLVSS
jgi:hypothetical protein